MYIKEFVKGTFVADIKIVFDKVQFNKFIELHKIRAVYIAPKENFDTYKLFISGVDVHPFGGGFMENSLLLFHLNTEVDFSYFEKITEIKYQPPSEFNPAQVPGSSVNYIIL